MSTPAHAFPPVHGFISLPSLTKGQQIHELDPLSQLSTNFETGTFSYLMCMVEQFPGLWAGRCSLTQSKPTGHGMSEWYYDLELYNSTKLLNIITTHSFIQRRVGTPVFRVQFQQAHECRERGFRLGIRILCLHEKPLGHGC